MSIESRRKPETFLESADVARTLGKVSATIRYHVEQGNIRPSAFTRRGVALFTERDVEQLRVFLAARRQKA